MHFPAPFSRVLPGDLIHNFPVLSLLFANLVTIVLAVIGNWDLATVMFIYWAQSIIIGFFTVLTLLLAEIPPEAPETESPELQPGGLKTIHIRNPWAGKGILAGFFILHYGFFHWVYFSFIVESGIFGTVNLADPNIWLSCGLFFVNHLYSYITYTRHQTKGTLDIIETLVSPYRRIVPMHMTIIFGGILLLILQLAGIQSTLPVLVLFLVIKTGADMAAHIDKHRPKTCPDGVAGSSWLGL
jgi:hypothetical protein